MAEEKNEDVETLTGCASLILLLAGIYFFVVYILPIMVAGIVAGLCICAAIGILYGGGYCTWNFIQACRENLFVRRH